MGIYFITISQKKACVKNLSETGMKKPPKIRVFRGWIWVRQKQLFLGDNLGNRVSS